MSVMNVTVNEMSSQNNTIDDDDDVLQLLTGDNDEFDADIDEYAEEELLREDVNELKQISLASGDCVSHPNNNSNNKNNSNAIKTIMNHSANDDEEDDEEKDRGRERFKSERIMSLASVPTRRREIPDSLDMIKVNLNDNNLNDKRRRNTKDKFIYNNSINKNNNNCEFNRQNMNQSFRNNQGLLPLPVLSNPIHNQHNQPHHQNQLYNQTPLYNQQTFQSLPHNSINVNNDIHQHQRAIASNSVPHSIHVNPHFRARAGFQFNDKMTPQLARQQEQQIRAPNSVYQSRPQYLPQQQNQFCAQQTPPLLLNQNVRQNFGPNCSIVYSEHQTRPQQQPPLIQHQPQQHQMQVDQHWRLQNQFSMQQNMGPLIPPQQQLAVNRPLNPPQMFMPQQPQQQQQQQPYINTPGFNPNFQMNPQLFMPTLNVEHKPLQIQQQNNGSFASHFVNADNAQRFPMPNSVNMNQLQYQHQMPFSQHSHPQQQQQQQPQPQQYLNQQQILNNRSPQKFRNQLRNEMRNQTLIKPNKQETNSQLPKPLKPINKLLAKPNESQKFANTSKAALKKAKLLLNQKKIQNSKEEPNNSNIAQNAQNSSNVEIEVEVGVDEEYKKKMEQQRLLREECLKKKEERRKAMASQRLMDAESKTIPLAAQQNRIVIQPKPKNGADNAQKQQFAKQKQQQIATLVNRSPQIQQRIQSKLQPQLRVVKTLNTEQSNNSVTPNASMTPLSISTATATTTNANQKRSVLIKGLASTTTELAIKRLCKLVGPIESCKFSTNGDQRSAVVTFFRAQDAITFQSKHERTLLDLCIIQVSHY